MILPRLSLALLLCTTLLRARAQDRTLPPDAGTVPSISLSDRLTDLLQRSSDGHSPTPDDIAALTNQPAPTTPADLRRAIPLIEKALENPDGPVRTYVLTALVSLQSQQPAIPDPTPATAPADPNAPAQPEGKAAPPTGPATYKPDLLKLLTPEISKIAPHLTEELQPNRLLAATIFGGFTPNPPSAVYPPLLEYLKRDDAISPVGQAVVEDLLQLAPVTPATAAAISTYLRRSDQTADTRANLVDAIAAAPNQSQSLNQTVLALLDSDDPSLRARIILSLPALDLTPDAFADTKSRIATLATNDQENLQVINAAKAVSPCWTAVKMTTGCPVYQ